LRRNSLCSIAIKAWLAEHKTLGCFEKWHA
jgi:hypothetical protein